MLTAPAAGPSCSPSSPLSVTGSTPTTQWIWLHSACLSLLMIQENLGQSQYQKIRFYPVHSGLKSKWNQKRHRWKHSFVLIFVNATENGFSRNSVSILTRGHYGTILASCPKWLKHKIYANLVYALLGDLRGKTRSKCWCCLNMASISLVYFICKLLSVTSSCLKAHAATVIMRQEHILFSGVCSNECIRWMAQSECGMDELAVERLLQTVKDDSLKWHFYYSCWHCLPLGTRQEKENRDRGEERGEEEGVNAVMLGWYYVSENSHREKILFLYLDVPGEVSWKILFYLFLGELQKTL